MDIKSLKRLELDKILSSVSGYANLAGGKRNIVACAPSTNLNEVRTLLACTEECDKLLYRYGIGKVGYFGELEDIIKRAEKGSALTCGELLEANALLRSARTVYEGISKIDDESISIMRNKADKLYYDVLLERDIEEKIISQIRYPCKG